MAQGGGQVKSLFLACALALPVGSVHYQPKDSLSVGQYLVQLKELKRFQAAIDPRSDWQVVPDVMHLIRRGWELLPFQYRGNLIYRRSA